MNFNVSRRFGGVRRTRSRRSIISVLGTVLTLLVAQQAASTERTGNTHIDEYMRANWNAQIARGIPYPSRTEAIVLRGSWYEMGRQYGQSKADYIRIVYDAYYELWLKSKLDPSKLGMILDRYTAVTQQFTPEIVTFIRGMSDGAASRLNGAEHASALTNGQKIMLINCLFEVVVPPAWPHVAELMNMALPPHLSASEFEPFASHAWAAWGDMTASGRSIIGGTRDQPWMPTMYNTSYVAMPSDPRASKTWGNVVSGLVAASAQVNAHGVGIANTVVPHKHQYFGVPVLLVTAHISFFARSAEEATAMFTVGTREYRRRTGRSTLAGTVGFFQVFADASKGIVVERTGRHYAVRTAGSQGERGDYTVLANHAMAAYSTNEHGKPAGRPMENWTVPSNPDSSSSHSRYWALYHEFGRQRGKLNAEMAQRRIAPMKYSYTPGGRLVTEKGGVPIWRLGLTPERWLIPNPADPNSMPTGGNNMYFIADLRKCRVYWLQGIPSHWNGAWESVSLCR
jgi:hypothetical protein